MSGPAHWAGLRWSCLQLTEPGMMCYAATVEDHAFGAMATVCESCLVWSFPPNFLPSGTLAPVKLSHNALSLLGLFPAIS